MRKRALAEAMKHVHYEDENTRYIDIGPVNKVGESAQQRVRVRVVAVCVRARACARALPTLTRAGRVYEGDQHALLLHRGPQQPGVPEAQGSREDYLWVAEDGMKMQSYNGSQLGTLRSMQALAAAGLSASTILPVCARR